MSSPYNRRAWRRASRAIRGQPCHWCGRPSSQLDHVEALAEGGARLDPANLVPACQPCNARRGAQTGARVRLGIGSRSRAW